VKKEFARSLFLVALAFTYMLYGVLLNSVGAVILQVVSTMGVSNLAAATIEAFKDLPIAVTSLFVASFLPRLGYRYALVIGLAIVGTGCVLMPFFPSLAMVRLLFMMTGASFALVKIATYSSIGLVTNNARQHASLMAIIEGLFMTGVLSGYWLFGVYMATPGLKWLNVYHLLAAVCILPIIVLLTARIDESAARSIGRPVSKDILAMLDLMKVRLVLVFMISVFLYVLIEQSVGTWLPTFNRDVLHLPAAMSVQAAGIFAASIAAGRLGGGLVLRRAGWYPLVCTCVIGIAALVLVSMPMARGLPVIANMTWTSAPLAAFVFPLIGVFLAPVYPAINSAMLSSLDRRDHAAMTGLLVVFSALGGTIGSFLTGRIFAILGGQIAFYCVLLPIAGIFVSLHAFKRLHERAPLLG
jgi:MFS transporter, FHS family, glucose/mannose:H+ symporter